METINHHAAAVFILSDETKQKCVVQVYDNGYPVSLFRSHFNLCGGNAGKDNSPLSLLKRELNEEWSDLPLEQESETVGAIIGAPASDVKNVEYVKGRIYAPRLFRQAFYNAVLGNLVPYRDYRINIAGAPIGKKEDLDFISSVYVSRINPLLITELEEELSQEHELTNEGITRVFRIDALMRGDVRGAWACPTILRDILCLPFPDYDFVRVTKGEQPRASFAEYKQDFQYRRDPEC